MKQKIFFDNNLDIRGTCLKDYLQHPYSFTEAVTRLFYVVDYNIFQNRIRDDSTFEIRGKINGKVFTIYDRGDCMIHIGGVINLDIEELQIELLKLMCKLDQVKCQTNNREISSLISCWKFCKNIFPIFNI